VQQLLPKQLFSVASIYIERANEWWRANSWRVFTSVSALLLLTPSGGGYCFR